MATTSLSRPSSRPFSRPRAPASAPTGAPNGVDARLRPASVCRRPPAASLRAAAVILSAAAAATSALAQDAPYLVGNVHSVRDVRDSRVFEIFDFGGFAFLAACTESDGCGLWRSDGTAAGTVLLFADITATEPPTALAALGGGFAFVFGGSATGREPHWSDGTAAGTGLLADVLPGPQSSTVVGFAAMGGLLYFGADDGTTRGLWRTDGTTAGTQLVHAFDPAFGAWYFPLVASDIAALDDAVFFAGFEPASGIEPWLSDGTPAGTRPLADLVPGGGDSWPYLFTRMGSRILFSGYTPAEDYEPWATDGTAAGTVLLTDITPGTGSYPWAFTAAADGSFALFGALDPNGLELWRTDGTPAGTFPVVAEPLYPMGLSFATLGSDFYFAGWVAGATRLWRSDGTLAGTRPVFPDPPEPGRLVTVPVVLDGVVYFQSRLPNEVSIWSSDGTTAGTQFVATLGEGGSCHGDNAVSTAAGRIFTTAYTLAEGREPWVSDGTAAGTTLLADLQPTIASAGMLSAVGDRGALHAVAVEDTDRDRDPDCNPPRSVGRALRRATSVPSSSEQRFVGVANAPLRATPAGPVFLGSGLRAADTLADLVPADALASIDRVLFGPPWPAAPADLALFFGRASGGARELWATDGSPGGTRRLAPWPEGYSDWWRSHPARLGDSLYFPARTPGGHGIGRTDGTAAGTGVAAEFPPDTQALLAWPAGDRILLAVAEPPSQYIAPFEPWISDGTQAGTLPLGVTNPRGHSLGVAIATASDPRPDRFARPAVARGRIVFPADDGASGLELWTTDGTPAGTTLLADIFPGPGGSLPEGLTLVGDAVVFAASHPATGRELWRTDGTAAGTVLVRDILPGPESSSPSDLTPLPGTGLVVFAATGPEGREPWVSDGTAAGTRPIADLRPGPGSSRPRAFTPAEAVLFFTADPDGGGHRLFASAFASGSVPGRTGSPDLGLQVRKASGDDVRLSWGPSCVETDDDSVVYEGAIGDFGSHAPVACSTAGAREWTLPPAGAATYYLVAPRTAAREGGLGEASDGSLRGRAAGECAPPVATACW